MPDDAGADQLSEVLAAQRWSHTLLASLLVSTPEPPPSAPASPHADGSSKPGTASAPTRPACQPGHPPAANSPATPALAAARSSSSAPPPRSGTNGRPSPPSESPPGRPAPRAAWRSPGTA